MSEMVVPDGWEMRKLGNCCDVLDSQRIPLNAQDRAKRKGVYPYYGANSIQDYVDDFIFNGESVLLAEDGGYFDEYAYRPIAQYATGKYWVNNHAHILKGQSGVLTKWIYYSLVHKNILRYINIGTRAKLNQSELKDIKVHLPPLPEQQKIASILTSVDEVIEKTQLQIDKLKDLKKGTMNELLTKGIGHTEFKDSPVGKIPKGWGVDKLGGVISKIIDFRGRTPKKLGMEWGDGDIRALSANNVKMGKIDFDRECYLASESLYKKWMTKGNVEKNDILFTMEAPLGNVTLVPDDKKYILSQRVILLRGNSTQIYYQFLFHQLRSDSFQEQIRENSTGSTALGIQQKKLVKLSLVIPPLPEQQKIASILSSIDTHIEEKQHKLEQTQSLKKSLMQDLLTGKVRVAVH